jgi:hypothetical protein
MAQSIETIIANQKWYADAAISDGNLVMLRIEEAMSAVNNNLDFLTDDTSEWDYTDIGGWADHMYDAVVSDNPDTKESGLLTSIGVFNAFKPLTYTKDIQDLEYVRNEILDIIDELLALPDRFTEAALAFSALTAYAYAGIAGAISGSASAVLSGGAARQGLVQSQILEVPITKFGSSAGGTAQAVADGAVGIAQIGDLVAHTTLELQRRARAFWLKSALDMAIAQSGLNKEKYTTIVATLDAILELGKAEGEEGDIEFKINELKFRKDEAYSKVLETLRAIHFQRWSAQFGIATQAFSVLQQANVNQLHKDQTIISGSHERVKAQLAEFTLESQIRSRALNSVASLMGQKVSGALASLNTLVGKIEEITAD